jgi:hypothetical protein
MVKKPKKPSTRIQVKDLDSVKNPTGGKLGPTKPPVPGLTDIKGE